MKQPFQIDRQRTPAPTCTDALKQGRAIIQYLIDAERLRNMHLRQLDALQVSGSDLAVRAAEEITGKIATANLSVHQLRQDLAAWHRSFTTQCDDEQSAGAPT